jgi:serine/threonine-protein kinase RsbW
MSCRSIRISIDSRLENVALVGDAVNQICSHHAALDEVAAYQLEVCVVEAVNNDIKHAYGQEENHTVDVFVRLYPDRVEFDVCNDGQPIPEDKISTPPTMDFDPTDFQSLPVGGMGLFIIHEFMDSVRYESKDGRNVLSFMKTLPQSASAAM